MSIPPYSIVRYPASVLAEPTNPVTEFDASLGRIIKRMVPTMRTADGIGLAANQVGLSLSLAVLEYSPRTNHRGRSRDAVPLHAIVNPVILSYAATMDEVDEGCLSCPGIEVAVRRATSIVVEFYSVEGKKTIKEIHGFPARIYQHEIDHLNGLLILDRAESQQALIKAYRANPDEFMDQLQD